MKYFENLRSSVIYQEWSFVNVHHVVGFPVHHHINQQQIIHMTTVYDIHHNAKTQSKITINKYGLDKPGAVPFVGLYTPGVPQHTTHLSLQTVSAPSHTRSSAIRWVIHSRGSPAHHSLITTNRQCAKPYQEQCHSLGYTLPGFPSTPLTYHYKPSVRQAIPGAVPFVGLYTPRVPQHTTHLSLQTVSAPSHTRSSAIRWVIHSRGSPAHHSLITTNRQCAKPYQEQCHSLGYTLPGFPSTPLTYHYKPSVRQAIPGAVPFVGLYTPGVPQHTTHLSLQTVSAPSHTRSSAIRWVIHSRGSPAHHSLITTNRQCAKPYQEQCHSLGYTLPGFPSTPLTYHYKPSVRQAIPGAVPFVGLYTPGVPQHTTHLSLQTVSAPSHTRSSAIRWVIHSRGSPAHHSLLTTNRQCAKPYQEQCHSLGYTLPGFPSTPLTYHYKPSVRQAIPGAVPFVGLYTPGVPQHTTHLSLQTVSAPSHTRSSAIRWVIHSQGSPAHHSLITTNRQCAKPYQEQCHSLGYTLPGFPSTPLTSHYKPSVRQAIPGAVPFVGLYTPGVPQHTTHLSLQTVSAPSHTRSSAIRWVIHSRGSPAHHSLLTTNRECAKPYQEQCHSLGYTLPGFPSTPLTSHYKPSVRQAIPGAVPFVGLYTPGVPQHSTHFSLQTVSAPSHTRSSAIRWVIHSRGSPAHHSLITTNRQCAKPYQEQCHSLGYTLPGFPSTPLTYHYKPSVRQAIPGAVPFVGLYTPGVPQHSTHLSLQTVSAPSHTRSSAIRWVIHSRGSPALHSLLTTNRQCAKPYQEQCHSLGYTLPGFPSTPLTYHYKPSVRQAIPGAVPFVGLYTPGVPQHSTHFSLQTVSAPSHTRSSAIRWVIHSRGSPAHHSLLTTNRQCAKPYQEQCHSLGYTLPGFPSTPLTYHYKPSVRQAIPGAVPFVGLYTPGVPQHTTHFSLQTVSAPSHTRSSAIRWVIHSQGSPAHHSLITTNRQCAKPYQEQCHSLGYTLPGFPSTPLTYHYKPSVRQAIPGAVPFVGLYTPGVPQHTTHLSLQTVSAPSHTRSSAIRWVMHSREAWAHVLTLTADI